MALKGFIWAAITLLAVGVAAIVVICILLLGSYLEKHRSGVTADVLNYAFAGAAIYHFGDDPEDAALNEATQHAGGNR